MNNLSRALLIDGGSSLLCACRNCRLEENGDGRVQIEQVIASIAIHLGTSQAHMICISLWGRVIRPTDFATSMCNLPEYSNGRGP
jgi:hypothetical protein